MKPGGVPGRHDGERLKISPGISVVGRHHKVLAKVEHQGCKTSNEQTRQEGDGNPQEQVPQPYPQNAVPSTSAASATPSSITMT